MSRLNLLSSGCFDECVHVYNQDVACGRVNTVRGFGAAAADRRADLRLERRSGAPSPERLRLRLRLRDPPCPGTSGSVPPPVRVEVMMALFGLGYAVSSAVRVLHRDRRRATGSRAHAVGTSTGWASTGGRLVNSRT